MKNLFRFNFLSLTPLAILILLANMDFNLVLDIEGYWVFDTRSEFAQEFDRKSDFQRGKKGVAFLSNGKMLKRQNAGWCGTPPVSYKNFDGAWEWLDDTTISMTYKFWGGDIKETWEIKSVKNGRLITKPLTHDIIKDD